MQASWLKNGSTEAGWIDCVIAYGEKADALGGCSALCVIRHSTRRDDIRRLCVLCSKDDLLYEATHSGNVPWRR